MNLLRTIQFGTCAYFAVFVAYMRWWVVPSGVFGWILPTFVALVFPFMALFAALCTFVSVMWVYSQLMWPEKPAPAEKYYVIHDKELAQKYKGRAMPFEEAFEAYFVQKLDFKHDLYTILREHREEIFRFCFSWTHIRFVLFKLVPQALDHSKNMDGGEVKAVYNRGNDFYEWFLGPTMVYTSGIYVTEDDSLEEAQIRKLDTICTKADIKPGHKVLDIGCGWGTLARHMSKNYGADAMGLTICQEQVNYAAAKIQEDGTEDKCRCVLMDYRDIPEFKYDRITCIEMAEHVGVLRFQSFLNLVSDRLKDDGIFFLQIAGLRRSWRLEDLIWGVFMGTYIFPAADASMPLAWVIEQLEDCGFEAWSVQNVGIHYSITLKQWYDNWLKNRDAVVAKYGEWWFRLWCIFLSWSSIIASQGSSTCWQITCHKNLNSVNRKRYIGVPVHGVLKA